MSNEISIVLYTTLGCHLCEQAEVVIARVSQHLASHKVNLSLSKTDIAEDASLVDAYGIRIPVVRVLHSEIDIGWPFDENALLNYLMTNDQQNVFEQPSS